MTAAALLEFQVGDRVYYRGRHYTIAAAGSYLGEAGVQLVRDGQAKPGRFGWITLRSLRAAGAVRSGS